MKNKFNLALLSAVSLFLFGFVSFASAATCARLNTNGDYYYQCDGIQITQVAHGLFGDSITNFANTSSGASWTFYDGLSKISTNYSVPISTNYNFGGMYSCVAVPSGSGLTCKSTPYPFNENILAGNTLGCPSGYTSYDIFGGYQVGFHTKVSMCLGDPNTTTPVAYFGGIYSYNNNNLADGNYSGFGNPFNGHAGQSILTSNDCPSGYTPVDYFTDEHNYEFHYCYTTDANLARTVGRFGGTWQRDNIGDGSDATLNPFTSGYSCPAGFNSTDAGPSGYYYGRNFYICYQNSFCGNGIVESLEQCDDGGLNGTTGDSCSSSCTRQISSAPCGDNPFSDVTSELSHNIVWTFNPRLGYFVGSVTLTNNNSNLSFKGPIWYEVASTTNWWLRYPNGVDSSTGRNYVDITGLNLATSTIYVDSNGKSIYQQLQSSGDGDLVLDPGESVTVTGIQLMGRATPNLNEALFSNTYINCPTSCSVSPSSAFTRQTVVTWTASSTGSVGPLIYNWIGDEFVNGKTTASVSGIYATSTPSIKHATVTVGDGISTSTISCPTVSNGAGIIITDPTNNGACVIGGQYMSKPTDPYLCLYGNANPNPVNGGTEGPWSWSCIGDGPGHLNPNCTATKLNPLDPALTCTLSMSPYFNTVSVNNNTTWVATSTRSFSQTRWTVGSSTPVVSAGKTLNNIFTTIGLKTVTAEIASSTSGVFGPPCSATTTIVLGGVGSTTER